MKIHEKLFAAVLVGALLWALFGYPWVDWTISCLRAGPTDLRQLTIAGELGIALAYTAIPVTLVAIWTRLRVRPHASLLVLYGAFIVLCGATHALGIALFWRPELYWIAAKLKVFTAAVSIAVAYVTYRERRALVGLGEQGAALAKKNEELWGALRSGEAARAEAEGASRRLEEQLAVAERHRRTIARLSIPMLQIGPSVTLIPIIGTLDSERAAQVSDALLARVAAGQADYALLDLTGVDAVDTQTASYVIGFIKAAKLMGGKVIVTGVQPAVAQTMTSLQVDLGVSVHRTIERGLAALRATTPGG